MTRGSEESDEEVRKCKQQETFQVGLFLYCPWKLFTLCWQQCALFRSRDSETNMLDTLFRSATISSAPAQRTQLVWNTKCSNMNLRGDSCDLATVLWCWNLDASGSRSQTPGKFRNVVLEKDGEDQLDRSCEKWRSVTLSEWPEEYPTRNKKTEG
jgi:hypothetical protein